MKAFLAAYFFSMFLAFGQPTYPYPEPKPTNGVSPIKVIGLSTAIGPSHYENENPAVWDTDIGGGLQSRTNEVDRMNTRWMRLGAIVMDQTDRTYYGVDVLPGTTNLAPWRPLFSLDGQIVGDESIYNTSGPLEDYRTVDVNGKSLTFGGVGQFTVSTTGAAIQPTGPLQLYGNDVELMGRTSFKLRTPGTLNNTVTNNWVFTLLDRTTGLAEWKPAPTGTNVTGTNVIDTSIYLNDGGILTDRKFSMNQHHLAFDGGNGSGNFVITNLNQSFISGQSVMLAPAQSLHVSTTKTRAGQVSLGDMLIVTSLSIPTNYVTVDFAHQSAIPTFYNTNANIVGDRTVNFTGALNFGANSITVDSPFTIITGDPELHIITPLVNSLTAPPKGVLTLMNNTGLVEFQVPAAGKNIYNTSDVLTSNRVVTGGNWSLNFQGMSNLVASAQNKLTLQGLTSVEIRPPNYLSALDGDVLKFNAGTGGVDYRPDTSIYTRDGTNTGDRYMVMDGHHLDFHGSISAAPQTNRFNIYNVGKVSIFSQTNDFIAAKEFIIGVNSTGRMRFVTPNMNSSANGKVLMVIDGSVGSVDVVGPTNIYSGNGTLLSHRTITGGGKDLGITNLNDLTLQAVKLKMLTPGVKAGSMSGGFSLQLKDAATGEVEFGPNAAAGSGDGSIYANDGSLTNNRIVNLAGKSLNFTNGPLYAVNSVSNVVIGTGADWNISGNLRQRATTKFQLETPRVVSLGAPALANQVLTMAADGSADFQVVSTVGPDTSIYNGSGTQLGNTTVTGAGRDLTFSGQNNFTVVSTIASITAPTTTIGGTTKLAIQAPGFAGATNGSVLTKIGSDGASAWQAVPTPNTIYLSDGTLSNHRTVSQTNFSLVFNGGTGGSYYGILNQGSIDIASLGPLSLAGQTGVKIKTPNVFIPGSGIATGYVPTLTAVDGTVEFAPPRNIYTENGGLTGDRTLFGNRHQMTMVDLFGLNMQADFFTINAPSQFKIITGTVGAGSVPDGWVLTTLDGIGTADWRPPSVITAPTTIYSGDGSLLGPRKVSMIGNSLTFQGPGNWTVTNASAVTLRSLGDATIEAASGSAMRIRTPLVTKAEVDSPQPGTVLTLQNADGRSEFLPLPPAPPTLYSQSGTLSSPRTVNGDNKNLTFNNIAEYRVEANNMTVKAANNMYVQTPAFAAVPNGSALTLMDNTTGRIEFQPIPTTPPGPGTGNVMEYHATLNGSLVGSTLYLTPTAVSPNPGTNTIPANGTRLIGKIESAVNVEDTSGAAVYMYWPGFIPGTNTTIGVFPPEGSNFNDATFVNGLYVEFVFIADKYPLETDPYYRGGWVMLNTGWTSTTHPPALAFKSTNSITKVVSQVSLAGVVDLTGDLAAVPLGFKKISTLGTVAPGDGTHADYFLTAYDPTVPPALYVRSTVNSNRMWKKLTSP